MFKTTQHLVRLSLLASLLLSASGAQAAILVYTDRAAYQAAMSHTVVDQFGDLSGAGLLPGPVQRTTGGASYAAGAVDLAGYGPDEGADALYSLEGAGGDTWLSTNFATSALQFGDFGPRTRGLGGYFFGTDVDGALLAGILNFAVQDAGGIFNYAWSSGGPDSFLAFASDSAMLSMTITAEQGQQPLFATAHALEIGIVPEPGSAALLSIAGLAMLLARRRR